MKQANKKYTAKIYFGYDEKEGYLSTCPYEGVLIGSKDCKKCQFYGRKIPKQNCITCCHP